jgi:hypothetical protein
MVPPPPQGTHARTQGSTQTRTLLAHVQHSRGMHVGTLVLVRIILPSTAPPSILKIPHPSTIRTTPVRRPQRVLLGTHQSGAKGVEWCRYDEPAMPRTLLASLRVQCVHGPRYWLHRQAVVLKQGVMCATQTARAHTLTLTHRTLARTHAQLCRRHANLCMHSCA